MNKLTLVLAIMLTGSLAFSAQARDQRDYHEMVYDSGCKTCHDQGIKNMPSDQACSQCHDIDELAVETARQGDEEWQNPHNNLHYGKEVPCTECHGEHTPKQVLCSNCHTFEYPKHK